MSKHKAKDKLKEGVSVQELEEFARKYTSEVFTVLAILIGAISSVFHFFTGPGMTIIFFAIGAIWGIIGPIQVEHGLKQFYEFIYRQEKNTQMILGAVKLVVALFIPFVLFGFVGLMAGIAYHHYTRHAQFSEANTPKRHQPTASGDEHD